jgi:hypothetical protein
MLKVHIESLELRVVKSGLLALVSKEVVKF